MKFVRPRIGIGVSSPRTPGCPTLALQHGSGNQPRISPLITRKKSGIVLTLPAQGLQGQAFFVRDCLQTPAAIPEDY